jgi:hypothetical protein
LRSQLYRLQQMLVIRFLFRHIFASARLCGSHRLILHDFIHAG